MITVSTHSNLILSQTWTNVGSSDTQIRAVCWPNKNRVEQNKCHQRVEMLHCSCTLQHYSYTLPGSAKRLLQKRDFKDRPFRYINEKKEKRKENPRGLKTGEKSLILVTFHQTKKSDMLGVKSSFKNGVVCAENGATERLTALSAIPAIVQKNKTGSANKCFKSR